MVCLSVGREDGNDMRLIAFSDLHSNEWDDFSYQLENGLNSRLSDCLAVPDKVAYYRDKYDCDVVLNAGDTFHMPMAMDTVVFQETYKQLEKLADTSKHMITLAGNHDMASITKDGNAVSTVYALNRLPNTEVVIGKYRAIAINEVVFHCMPYIKDKDVLDKAVAEMAKTIEKWPWLGNVHIIITHIGLDEARNGPNEIQLKGYSVAKLRKLGAQKIIAGHHHHPQRFGGTNVVGSPLQHNMSDRGDKRGLLVYDTKTDETTRIWLRNSRFFFYEITSNKSFEKMQREQEDFRGGYVRVALDTSIKSESKVADIVGVSAKMYRILPVKHLKSGVRSAAISKLASANIGNLSVVVPDYIEYISPPGLNKQRLITVGKGLLR